MSLLVGYLVVQGVVLVGLLVFTHTRKRHGEAVSAKAHWRMTSEVFVDPTTKRHMRVWLDEHDQRKYVPER